MASELTATPVRYTGRDSIYTGLPKIPSNTPVAESGDEEPCSRVIRWSSTVPSTTLTPTWFAQGHMSFLKCVLVQGVGSTMYGYVIDPETVDWNYVTLTHNRPQNPNGGMPRYAYDLGAATYIKASGTPMVQSTGVGEDRQPVLAGLNNWSVARKLPPLVALNLASPQFEYSYASGTLGSVYAVGSEIAKAFRYLGGSITIAAINPTGAPPSITASVWAVPMDMGTMEGNWTDRGLLGTLTLTPGVLTSATYTQAQILAAGITRWDQFWLVTTAAGAPAECTSFYTFFAPTDVPPLYNCPGVDSVILGGYIQ